MTGISTAHELNSVKLSAGLFQNTVRLDLHRSLRCEILSAFPYEQLSTVGA